MKRFREIFQNRTFRNLFLATFTSQMGSTIGLTAFMFYLLDRFTNQPVYATVTELMYSLPTLAVFFLVGVFADRMDRQKIAYYCDLISASFSLVLIAVIAVGWMPLIFFVLFTRSAISKFFYPAEGAIVQGILKKDDYTTAAGLNQLVMSLFMLFGNGLGVFAYWSIGIYGAILLDALTFLISAYFIKSISIPEHVRLPNGNHTLRDLKLSLVFKDFKVGFAYILGNKLLRTLLVGFIVFGVVNGGFSVIPIFMLKYKLAPETYEIYSIWIGVTFGSGVLIGSFIASLFSQKVKLYQMIIFGLFVSGAFIVLASFSSNIYFFMSLIFMAALGLPFINIAIGGWMPSIVDPKMMGRVQGWINPLMMFSQSLTLGIVAITFPKVVTVEMLYWLVGGCLMLVGAYYLISLPKFSSSEKISKNTSLTEQSAL
jgi:MFS transporter, DHA3 family, macrolide efflux protein